MKEKTKKDKIRTIFQFLCFRDPIELLHQQQQKFRSWLEGQIF